MKIPCIILIIIICVFFPSCESHKQEQPEHVTFDTVFNSKYDPVKILGFSFHKRIAIEGYFAMVRVVSSRAGSLNILLFEKSNSMGRSITANIQIGYNQNQIEKLPKYYSNDDIKIHTKENEIVGVNQRVRITGKRYCNKKKNSCYIIVDMVEKV